MTDNFLQRNWRPLAAITYLLICLMDFFIMPFWCQLENYRNPRHLAVTEALRFTDSASQIAALESMTTMNVWKPITLEGAGLVHISFGAIIGVAAWGRTREKVQKILDGKGAE